MDGPRLCAACRLQPVDVRWRPFCSRRCQLADRAAWADGAYRVPGPPVSTDDDHDD